MLNYDIFQVLIKIVRHITLYLNTWVSFILPCCNMHYSLVIIFWFSIPHREEHMIWAIIVFYTYTQTPTHALTHVVGDML